MRRIQIEAGLVEKACIDLLAPAASRRYLFESCCPRSRTFVMSSSEVAEQLQEAVSPVKSVEVKEVDPPSPRKRKLEDEEAEDVTAKKIRESESAEPEDTKAADENKEESPVKAGGKEAQEDAVDVETVEQEPEKAAKDDGQSADEKLAEESRPVEASVQDECVETTDEDKSDNKETNEPESKDLDERESEAEVVA